MLVAAIYIYIVSYSWTAAAPIAVAIVLNIEAYDFHKLASRIDVDPG